MVRTFKKLAAFAALMLLSTGTALACACCGTYQVTGVEQDDVLNMRSGAGVRYSKVGAIPAGSGCVIKSRQCRRNWCRVNYAGTSGWVNMRFLRYMK